jgi:hypothetical protein
LHIVISENASSAAWCALYPEYSFLLSYVNTIDYRQFKSQDHQKGQEDRPTSSCLGHHFDPSFGGVVQRAFWDESVAEHLMDFGSILQFCSLVSAGMIVVEEKGSHGNT